MLTTWFVRDAPRVWLRYTRPGPTARCHTKRHQHPGYISSKLYSFHLSKPSISDGDFWGVWLSGRASALHLFGANLRKVRVSITRPSNSFAKINSSIKMCCRRFFVHVAACQERRSYYKLHLWCLLTMLSTFFHLIDRHIYKRMIDLRRKIGAS